MLVSHGNLIETRRRLVRYWVSLGEITKLRRLAPLLMLLSCAAPIFGNTVNFSSSDNNIFLFTASADYRFTTNGSGTFQSSQSGFGPAFNSDAPVTLDSAVHPSIATDFRILYSAPIAGATLNFARLTLSRDTTTGHADDLGATLGVPTGTHASSGGDYTPSFSAASGTLFINFSSTIGGTHTFAPPGTAGVTDFDLIAAGYGADIVAGNPINITWFQRDVISVDHSSYTGVSKNEKLTWTVTHKMNADMLAALSVSYQNHLAGIPEPGSLVLMGIGLLGIAGMARRSRKRT